MIISKNYALKYHHMVMIRKGKEKVLGAIRRGAIDTADFSFPIHLLLTLAITQKMKPNNSLTDVPFDITDAETLSEIDWNIWNNESGAKEGLMDEGTLRNIFG